VSKGKAGHSQLRTLRTVASLCELRLDSALRVAYDEYANPIRSNHKEISSLNGNLRRITKMHMRTQPPVNLLSAQTMKDWQTLLPPDLMALGKPIFAGGEANEMAWPFETTDAVIGALRRLGHAILGGDIYLWQADTFVQTYENWHCDLMPGEAWQTYLVRSCGYSLEWLTRFPASPAHWYSLVIAQKPSASQLVTSYAN